MMMNRTDRKRQAREDEKRLARGIDPDSQDPEPTAAMARQLHALLERAKREGDIGPPVKFLQAKVEATLRGMQHIPVACAKGCAHCCHTWVSATAPELLFVAKLLRRSNPALLQNVRAAHLATGDFDFSQRSRHPQACPLLEAALCSIYESRPIACRFAASMSAAICGRALRELSGEGIPTPGLHLKGRGVYETAAVIALRHASLPYHYYELNAGLARALERDDAEEAWLSGDDIFAHVRRDPNDAFANPIVGRMYQHAFGETRLPNSNDAGWR